MWEMPFEGFGGLWRREVHFGFLFFYAEIKIE
jgi:hypothetical protein